MCYNFIMQLSQIGEFGLIEILKKMEQAGAREDTIIGMGDDAAVLEFKIQKAKVKSKELLSLITTDALIENVHFRLKNTSFFHLGQKALLASISDIAAMGGIPTHALVTIGLPKKIKVEQVKELYRGISSLAKKNRIDIIGGDTVSSPKAMMISVTLLGQVEKRNLLLRSGAENGDIICVTGKFGGPAAAHFSNRHPLHVTRIDDARKIAKSKIANAMIDSSDGLIRSVLEICRASKVGARIWEDKVPIAKGANLNQALYGGEEYELVFTVPKSKLPKLKNLKLPVSLVGEITNRHPGVKLLDSRGKMKPLKSGGYEHFK